MRLWPFHRSKEPTALTVFDGHRAVWEWEFSAQAEKTITAACGVIRRYASADVLLVKAMDGQDWMSRFDGSPAAISGPQSLDAAVAEGQAAGVTVIPWVVPNTLADAEAHGALGPTLVVDLEPYSAFWTDSAANVAPYLAALTAAGVRNLFVSIDPRPSATAALGIEAWGQSVAGLLPQVYWTDFQRPYSECVGYVQTLAGFGVPIYPALPFDATPADLAAFWQAVQAFGVTSPTLWRLGSANGAQLNAFGALPVKRPVPMPDPADILALDRLLTADPLGSQFQALIDYARRFV